MHHNMCIMYHLSSITALFSKKNSLPASKSTLKHYPDSDKMEILPCWAIYTLSKFVNEQLVGQPAQLNRLPLQGSFGTSGRFRPTQLVDGTGRTLATFVR